MRSGGGGCGIVVVVVVVASWWWWWGCGGGGGGLGCAVERIKRGKRFGDAAGHVDKRAPTLCVNFRNFIRIFWYF